MPQITIYDHKRNFPYTVRWVVRNERKKIEHILGGCRCWRSFAEAFDHYNPKNTDQYGARVRSYHSDGKSDGKRPFYRWSTPDINRRVQALKEYYGYNDPHQEKLIAQRDAAVEALKELQKQMRAQRNRAARRKTPVKKRAARKRK